MRARNFRVGIALAAGIGLLGAGGLTSARAQNESAAEQTYQTGGTALPSFEVAAIKLADPSERGHYFSTPDPGRVQISNMDVRDMIEFAYNVKAFQVAGGPSWVDAKEYDIDAKIDDVTAAQRQKMGRQEESDQTRKMLLALLEERFKLQASEATKDAPEYALVVAKGGPKLKPTVWIEPAPGASKPDVKPGEAPHMMMGRGTISGVDQSMSSLANVLAFMPEFAGHLMVDHTGISGNYDFDVSYSGEAMPPKDPSTPPPAPLTDDTRPSIFTALEEQLGLKVETTRGPVVIYTIEHIEEPSAN